ncbi:MAG: AmmeMemoRadiSam system protein B [Brevinematales bacterium]|nr:AmmeMemoRadiSam system protein B [Brevinematales bacterium]
MNEIRSPAVAGIFYPEDSINLKRMINGFISEVPDYIPDYFKKNGIHNFFSIIVPHAGYIYSGSVAAYGYSLLKGKKFDTVILLGPSHYSYFEGFALAYFKSFLTPLGEIPIDIEFSDLLAKEGKGVFEYLKNAHMREHSLEVQLPFLQEILEEDFRIVPILMGEQNIRASEEGAEILHKILSNYEKSFLIVVSTDLSHYHNSMLAEKMDTKFINTIKELNPRKLISLTESNEIEACGVGPVATMLTTAIKMNRRNIKDLIYRHSGEVSKDYDRVVGYTSIAVW